MTRRKRRPAAGAGPAEPKPAGGLARGVVTGVLSLLLLFYVGYQAYHALYHSVTTQRVAATTVRDSFTAQGVVLHSETVLTADVGTGVVDYTRSDGERVAKNGTVAGIYSNAGDAAKAAALTRLQSQIQTLKTAGSSADVSAADVNVLDSRIDESLIELAGLTSSPGGLADLAQAQSRLLGVLNRKQLATGEVSDFGARIEKLQQQADALGSVKPVRSVTSPVAGYFVAAADGYENLYDTAKVLSISTADIQKLESAKPHAPAGAIGRVVSDYEWYVVCTVPNSDARRLKVGAAASMQFLLSSEGEVPVTVAAVNRAGDSSAVVLRCGVMTDKLAVIRRQTVQIVVSEISGLRVPNSVIHVLHNVKGVYVRNGNTIRFKTIQPLYSGKGFTISAADPTNGNLLQVYDEAVVKGDNLYDGKVVQ